MSFEKLLASFPPDFLIYATQLAALISVVALILRQLYIRLRHIEGKAAWHKSETKRMRDSGIKTRTEIARLKGEVKAKRSRYERTSKELSIREGGY